MQEVQNLVEKFVEGSMMLLVLSDGKYVKSLEDVQLGKQ
jgi:hypothetical protein